MPSELLINVGAGQTRIALVQDGILQGYAVASTLDGAARPGEVHLGRVTRVMAAMQAAFVNIGQERDGFLALRDAPGPVREGDALAVQVTREAMGEKGARLTAKVSLSPELEARCRMARPPALLATGPGPVERALAGWKADHVVTDDARTARDHGIELARDDLFLRHDLEDQVAILSAARVPLACGGWITIERTEGMTAIDVNSGSFAASGGRAETAHTVNRDAAREIGRQVRLRGIGGLIVVDFIQMAQGGEAVTGILRDALSCDPATVEILPMNSHGLVSIARQRLDTPLPAPRVEQQILRAVERAARAAPGREVVVHAAPQAVAWLSRPVVREGLDRRGVGRVRYISEARSGGDFDVGT